MTSCVWGDFSHCLLGGQKAEKEQKGPASEHIEVQQGAASNANKAKVVLSMGQKEKGLQSSNIGPLNASEDVAGISSSMERTDDEMRQAQNRECHVVARAEPEVGDGSPSRDATSAESGAYPRVVPRRSPVTNPSGWAGGPGRSATDNAEVSSAVRIRGSVLELAGLVNGRPIKVLMDSGATGNFISDRVVTALELQIEPEDNEDELTLADGSLVKARGRVQFQLHCGRFKQMVSARIFPNLHKEIILGMPWLQETNPAIDWAKGQIKVCRGQKVFQLPLATRRSKGITLGEVNMCSAKQMKKWIKQGGEAFLGFVRKVDEPVPVVPIQQTGSEVEKAFHSDMPQ